MIDSQAEASPRSPWGPTPPDRLVSIPRFMPPRTPACVSQDSPHCNALSILGAVLNHFEYRIPVKKWAETPAAPVWGDGHEWRGEARVSLPGKARA